MMSLRDEVGFVLFWFFGIPFLAGGALSFGEQGALPALVIGGTSAVLGVAISLRELFELAKLIVRGLRGLK